jgi:hypothetical protein
MRQKFHLLLCLFFLAPASLVLAEDTDQELVKQLSNPVASLISVPFQSNWDFRMGPLDKGWRYTMNFQPVIPVVLNDHWNLIIRTIVPYIHQDNVFAAPPPAFPGLPDDLLQKIPENLRGQAEKVARQAFERAAKKIPNDRYQDGLSDITQSFFLSPRSLPNGLIVGVGPAFLYPTATDDKLGSQKWGAGPTFILAEQQGGWTYGLLFNHLWSFAGDEDRRSVNNSFVQPFISYATKTKTTFTINSEATYDWNESQWTVPLNASVAQLVRIGKLPVQFTVGGRYYAEGPSGAPQWGLRFVITPLFPTGSKPILPRVLTTPFILAALASAAVAAPNGDQILHQMSDKLASAKSFTFEAQRETDPALLEDRDVPEKSRVSAVVRRPNQFAARSRSGEGTRRIIADGRMLMVFDEKNHTYAQTPMRTTLDGLVAKLDEAYGFTPPLLDFTVSNLYQDFHQQAHSVKYVATEKLPTGLLASVECYHLALKGPEADADLWVGASDSLPRKLVATFHRTGHPQVHVDFLRWNLPASVTDADFTFTAPPGAQKVEMWTSSRMEKQAGKTQPKKN